MSFQAHPRYCLRWTEYGKHRPASITINECIVDAFCTPDGSCLLVSVVVDESFPHRHKLLAFHTASFGSNEHGIRPEYILPYSDAGRSVTSVQGRDRIHILSFSSEDKTITSFALQVKQKITSFVFRTDQAESQDQTRRTVNNCLLDCHKEVWIRFPLLPTVSRSILSSDARQPRNLVFASPINLDSAEDYFTRMLEKFKETTHKPMDRSLAGTSVISSPDAPSALVQQITPSKYQLGRFIVELLCLIPLQYVYCLIP